MIQLAYAYFLCILLKWFASTFNVLTGSVPWLLSWPDYEEGFEEEAEEEEFVDDYAA